MNNAMRLFGAVSITALAWSLPVTAGSCPEEHVLSEARDLGSVSAKGVKVEVRESIALDRWRETPPLKMRMRHFTIEPGGIVPTHSHGDRPSIIYFVSGVMTEHNSLCAVPITHEAGTTAGEFGADIVHWWSNEGDETAILVSADIVPGN